MKNPHAQALQKLSHGIPKVYTEEEKELRRERLSIARSKRTYGGNARDRRKQRRKGAKLAGEKLTR